MRVKLPTRDELNQMLVLHEDGTLTWKRSGKPAFKSGHSKGYLTGSIRGVKMYTHRVVFKMVHGTEPEHIDHDDRDKKNNRPANLKESDPQRNQRNRGKSKNNTSGVNGVKRHHRGYGWVAFINAAGRLVHLGLFKKFDDAVKARREAEVKHEYSDRHGR